MKLIYILSIPLVSVAFGNGNCQAWMKLSAASQNLAFSLHSTAMIGFPNHLTHEKELKAVEENIQHLVAVGELDSFRIKLSPEKIGNLWDDEEFGKLRASLSERFGRYVAQDLLDLGSRIQFIQIDHPIDLTFRLPHEDMKKLKHILNNKQAEGAVRN